MREDPGPEQVGLGYRAVSAVGVTEDVLVRFIVGYDIVVDCWERGLYSKYGVLGGLRCGGQMRWEEGGVGKEGGGRGRGGWGGEDKKKKKKKKKR
jgi:hypothetical protein